MSACIWLLRHGDTEWTEEERHTGLRDVSLSEAGREQARTAGRALTGRRFDHVLVSPQRRAGETCELAGFGDGAVVLDDLVEWDYGDYEGLTDEQSRERNPAWDLFRDGAPGGEGPEEVTARVGRVLAELERRPGHCLVVGHGKLLRALGALWIGREIGLGTALPLDPAALAVLEHEAETGPLLRLWNYTPEVLSGR